MKISKIKPREPSLKFFLEEDGKIEVPQDINGIHRLAQFFKQICKKSVLLNPLLKENLNSSMKFFKTISIKYGHRRLNTGARQNYQCL
jgi:hypothetical protein